MTEKVIVIDDTNKDIYQMLLRNKGRFRKKPYPNKVKVENVVVEPVKEIKIKTPEEIAEEDRILAISYEKGTMGWVKQQKIKNQIKNQRAKHQRDIFNRINEGEQHDNKPDS